MLNDETKRLLLLAADALADLGAGNEDALALVARLRAPAPSPGHGGALLGMLDGGLFDVFGSDGAGLSLASLELGLSTCPRWRGQTRSQWSILQHSFAVRYVLGLMGERRIVQVAGAVHDLEEGVLGDEPTPWKRCLRVALPSGEIVDYATFALGVRARAIAALGLPSFVADLTESGPVKLADAVVLHAEARVLCCDDMPYWLGPLVGGAQYLDEAMAYVRRGGDGENFREVVYGG